MILGFVSTSTLLSSKKETWVSVAVAWLFDSGIHSGYAILSSVTWSVTFFDMGGGLLELRIKAPERIGRVFYCTVIDRRIVFLHHFVKKTGKTPPKELDIARKRMKDLKNG